MARKPIPPPAPPAPRDPLDARRLGAIALAFLLFLGIPGILLALRYHPDPARAHDAVVEDARGAWQVLRGAHWWAASALLAIALIHMGRAYVADRVRVPGRAVALWGLGALAIVALAFFSGTILPWDQQGWEAYLHLRSGAGLARVPIGTDQPADAPLRWIFYAHVFLVPALFALALGYHFRRGQLRADLARVARLLSDAWLPIALACAGLVVLGALFPPALGPAPLAGVQITRPDWPFLWLVPLQDRLGPIALYALPGLFLIAALALAFGRGTAAWLRRAVFAGLVLAWGALTWAAVT